jgi:hypothetical protein
VTTLLNRAGDSLLHPERTPKGWIHFVAFVAGTLLLAISAIALGPYPITKFPDDAFYFLTQGDLLLRSYRPGMDYHSMHGPFPFLFAAAAMHFRGISIESIVLAQTMGSVLFGCLMFRIASRRVSGFWTVFLAISVELILVSCTPIGSKTWREFTCAMWYNAIGYCIHATVFLYLLAPERQTNRIQSLIDDIVIAFCMAASLLTKTSYFFPMAIVFVVGTIVLPRPPLTRLRGCMVLAIAAVFAWGAMAALDGSLRGSFGLVESLSMKVSPITTSLRFVQYTRTIGLLLLGAGMAAWIGWEEKLGRRLIREGVLAVLMFGVFLVSAGTSAQDQEMLPMVGVIILGVLASIIVAARASKAHVNRYLLTPALAVAFLLVVHEPKNGLLSLVFAHVPVARTIGPPVERFSWSNYSHVEEYLAETVDRQTLPLMPRQWMNGIMDGVAMLQQAGVQRKDVVFVTTEVSPINMLTGTKYPAGTIVWWPSQFVEDPEACGLIDKELLSDVNYVLRRKVDEPFLHYLMFHRGDYLNDHFEMIAETPDWILYDRKQ